MSASQTLRINFLGGVGEIGMNCMALETPRGTVIIDCGVMFPDNRTLGPDLIIPDLRYFRANRDRIVAVVVSHGHEDHIGAIPIVFGDLAIPVYAPPFAAVLLREKALEYTDSPAYDLKTIRPGDTLELAGLEFEFMRVSHSIPDALAMAIRTPVGLIVHTADFRIDEDPTLGEPFDKEAFARLGDEGVYLLLSDSTNAEVPGRCQSERWVAQNIYEEIRNHPGRVLVSLFSSNVERVRLLAGLAEQVGRRLGLIGRSLYGYTRAGIESGYAPFDPNSLVDPYFADEMPGEKLLLLIAGSQGEPRSALTRVSTGEHQDIKIRPGDLVLYSSKIIPGNTRAIQQVSNDLVRAGARVLHEGNAHIHTSGHARQAELKELLELLRPRHFIPVHGEYRFLHEHAQLAQDTVQARCLIADWGDVIALKKGGPERVDHAELERYYVERPLIGHAEELKLRERKKLLFNGLAVVRCKLSKRGRKGLTVSSQVTLYGVPDPDGDLEAAIRERLKLEFVNRTSGLSPQTVEEEIRILVRRIVRKRHNRKPLVHVFLEGGISA